MTKRAVLGLCLTIATSAILAGRADTPALSQSGEPSQISPTSPANGRQMYLTYCATCHGRDGKGDGPAARSLKPPPSDLSKISAKNGGTFPLIIIRRYIDGIGGVAAHGPREMPIWGALFTDADRDPGLKELRITNLANYVKALQK